MAAAPMAPTALVIDTSYYIFYRYYATLKWSTQSGTVDKEAVRAAFERHFYTDFERWKSTGADIYFCIDCPRREIWRVDIFPGYKASRVTADSFDTEAFPMLYKILEEKLENITIVSGDKLEADDCAYLITCEILEKSPDTKIKIITNDNDYLQIDDRVEIRNMQGEDIRSRALKKLNAKTAAECLLMKILMGDKSDEIPPVCAGIGPKTAEKLVAMTESDRHAFLDKKAKAGGATGADYKAVFERNKTIISFENIPFSLRKIDIKKR